LASSWDQQFAQFGGQVVVAHQGFADEKGAGACLSEALDVQPGVNAALGDQEGRGRDA
jgi:hypothetical protein